MTEKGMDLGLCIIKMVKFMKEIGQKEKNMGLVFIKV
jgi:hypothetical protein